jgi:hypothetical protein
MRDMPAASPSRIYPAQLPPYTIPSGQLVSSNGLINGQKTQLATTTTTTVNTLGRALALRVGLLNSTRPNAVITRLVETLESIDARQARSMSEIRDAAAIYNDAEPVLPEAPSGRERQLALQIE